MKYIKIQDTDYPFKLTLNAIRKYEREFKKSFSQVGQNMTMDELIHIVYFGLQAGGRIEKKEFTMSVDDFADCLEPKDIERITEVAFLDTSSPEDGESDPNQ